MNGKPTLKNQPCDEFADRLVDLSDGELSAADAAIVREHCESCSACRLTLARLDRSLAVLERAIVTSAPVASPLVEQPAEPLVKRPPFRTAASYRGGAWAIAMSAAAAALVAVAIWANRNSGGAAVAKPGLPQVTHTLPANAAASQVPSRSVKSQASNRRAPDSPTGDSLTPDSTELIARRLALVEQVARLEASLAMLPDDPWFASQRTANECLLTGFRQAVQELSAAADKPQHIPSYRDEVL
jgi:anti-sigma factor RsiW